MTALTDLPPNNQDTWRRFLDSMRRDVDATQTGLRSFWEQGIDLSDWQAYADAELLGDCGQYLTEWATYLGYAQPASLQARYDQLSDLISAIKRCEEHNILTLEFLFRNICEQNQKQPAASASGAAYQSILALLGCLTLFFKWTRPPHDDWSAIEVPGSLPRSFRPQSFSAGSAERATGLLLASFGHILPKYSAEDGGLLHASVLNYSALHQFAKINISWVDHVGSHLAFNPMKKTLSVFAHPAYSGMCCSPDYNFEILSRITAGYFDDGRNTAADVILLMHQEILLSYRLLFGYNVKSRHLFNAMRPKKRMPDSPFLQAIIGPRRPGPLMASLQGFWYPTAAMSLASIPNMCWPEAALGPEGLLVEQDVYSSVGEFVIFGQKLLELQEYCNRRNPRRVWDMWHDRRNRREWITFWAVIFFGGLSIVFSFVQTILAGFQIYQSQNSGAESYPTATNAP